MYKGESIMDIKMTEPVDLSFELIVLQVYKTILEKIYLGNTDRFKPVDEDEPVLKTMAPHRADFVRVYRASQRRIIAGQMSLVNSCLSILNRLAVNGIKPKLAIA